MSFTEKKRVKISTCFKTNGTFLVFLDRKELDIGMKRKKDPEKFPTILEILFGSCKEEI